MSEELIEGVLMKIRIFLILCFLPSLVLAQVTSSVPHREGQEGEPIEVEFSTPYAELVKQGMDALATDSLDKAEACFRSALQAYPIHQANHILYRHLGKIKEKQEKQTEALEFYTSGLNLSPQNLELRLDRAALLYRMGDESRALSDYADVLERQPENIEALQMRAFIYAKKRDYKNARTDYETIIHLDPLNEKAYIGLILLNDRSGRPREAMEQINGLIAVYPRHAVLYAIRGGMEQQRKQYEQALADLSHAIELEPTNADFYVSRATLYLDMRKRKLARQDTQMAVKYGADPREMASLIKR